MFENRQKLSIINVQINGHKVPIEARIPIATDTSPKDPLAAPKPFPRGTKEVAHKLVEDDVVEETIAIVIFIEQE